MKVNKKGFSLIEILGVIVILGILSVVAIGFVTRLINKSKEESDNQNKRTLQMAAESYVSANKSILPKNIGERIVVSAEELHKKNYLKEEIVNNKGENCVTNSYVEVHKITKNTYDYNAFLFCGDEGAPSDSTNKPAITDLKFVDADKNPLTDYSNLRNAYISFRVKGGIDSSTNKAIPLESYHFSIAITNDGNNYLDAYNSGTLSANLMDEVEIVKKLSEFIDITKSNKFKIRVVAINNQGKKIERDITSDDFMDQSNPVCTDANSKGATDWINARSYVQNNRVRKISLTCSDGEGSGCIRKEFTRTWPNKEQHDAEFGYIKVTDNAGHSNLANDTYLKGNNFCDLPVLRDTCRVRVNVDTTYPILKIDAYKRGTTESKANNVSVFKNNVVKTIGGASADPTSEIQYNSYNVGSTANNWLNKMEFPNGIIYEINISDNLHLDSWTWKTNAPGFETTGGNYRRVREGNVGENKSGTFRDINPETENCGTRTTNTIYVSFTDEGRRYGEFTVKDKAGNATIYKIQANLDHTIPTCSLGVTGTKGNNGWYKTNNVTVRITNRADAGTSLLSRYGMGTSATNANYNSQTTNTQGNTTGITWYGYVIDNAGNTGTCNTPNLKVDTTNPTCSIGVNGVSGTNGWYKSRDVYLSLTRNDSYSGVGANLYGLTTSSSRSYNRVANTSQGNTGGVTWYGFVEDNAGNLGSCRTSGFKVDKTNPTVNCNLSGSYTRDSSNRIQISDTTSDNLSGITNKSYNMTNFSGSKATRVNELRSRSTRVTYRGSITAVDRAGNSVTIQCSGSLTVPATCDSVTWSGWSACTKACGGGTQTKCR